MIPSPSSLQASWLTPRKKAFLTGTLLLTGTGFLCRILGFFYRIFLSRTIGAEGLGIYNMVHPVFGICFSLCAGSLQTALSQYAAANLKKGRNAFYSALAASFSLSLLLAFLVCLFDEPIDSRLLLSRAAPPTSPSLPCRCPLRLCTPASMDITMECSSPESLLFPRWRNRSSAWEPLFF